MVKRHHSNAGRSVTFGSVHSRELAEHATTARLGDREVRRGAVVHRTQGSRRRCPPRPGCLQAAAGGIAGDGDEVAVHAPVRDHGSCFCCCGGRSVGLAQQLRDGTRRGAMLEDGVRLAQRAQRVLEVLRGGATVGDYGRGVEVLRQSLRGGYPCSPRSGPSCPRPRRSPRLRCSPPLRHCSSLARSPRSRRYILRRSCRCGCRLGLRYPCRGELV